MERWIKNVVFQVTIPETLKVQIEIIADYDGRSRNNMIAKILSDYTKTDEAVRILSEQK